MAKNRAFSDSGFELLLQKELAKLQTEQENSTFTPSIPAAKNSTFSDSGLERLLQKGLAELQSEQGNSASAPAVPVQSGWNTPQNAYADMVFGNNVLTAPASAYAASAELSARNMPGLVQKNNAVQTQNSTYAIPDDSDDPSIVDRQSVVDQQNRLLAKTDVPESKALSARNQMQLQSGKQKESPYDSLPYPTKEEWFAQNGLYEQLYHDVYNANTDVDWSAYPEEKRIAELYAQKAREEDGTSGRIKGVVQATIDYRQQARLDEMGAMEKIQASYYQLPANERVQLLNYAKQRRRLTGGTGADGFTYWVGMTAGEQETYKKWDDRWKNGEITPEQKEYVTRLANQEISASDNQKMYDITQEYPWLSGTLGTAATVMAKPAATLTSAVDFAGQFGKKAIARMRGQNTLANLPVDTNTYAQMGNQSVRIIRTGVGDNIADAIGGEAGKTAKFVYDTACSWGDSISMGVGGGGFGTFLLGTSAAEDAFVDAVENGASSVEALSSALTNGFFEGLFERCSIDNFKVIQQMGDSRSVWKKLLQSMLVEGSEELATELADILADKITLDDLSSMMQTYQEFIDAGESKESASRKTVAAMGTQVGLAGLGGALMGVFSTGAGLAIGKRNHAENVKKLQEQGLSESDAERIVSYAENGKLAYPEKLQRKGAAENHLTDDVEAEKQGNPTPAEKAGQNRPAGENRLTEDAEQDGKSYYGLAGENRVTEDAETDDAPMERLLSRRELLSAIDATINRTAGEFDRNQLQTVVNSAVESTLNQTAKNFDREQLRDRIMKGIDKTLNQTARNFDAVNRIDYTANQTDSQSAEMDERNYYGLAGANRVTEDAEQDGKSYYGLAGANRVTEDAEQDGKGYYGLAGANRVTEDAEQDGKSYYGLAGANRVTEDAEQNGNSAKMPTQKIKGLVQSEYAGKVGARTRRVFNAIGEKLSVGIELTELPEGINGRWIPDSNTIQISTRSKNPIRTTFTHELIHSFRQDGERFKQLYAAVKDALEQSGTYQEAANIIRRTYADEIAKDSSAFEDELTANFVSQLADNLDEFERFAGVHRDISQRILDALNDFVRGVSDDMTWEGSDGQKNHLTEQEQLLRADIDQLIKVRDAWKKILSEKAGQNQADKAEIRQSKDLRNPYDYQSLTAREDMPITIMEDAEIPTRADGTIDRTLIRRMAKANVRKLGNKRNTENDVFVYVKALNRDVQISTSGIEHGLRREKRAREMFLPTIHLGEILKNAIPINEINSVNQSVKEGTVLLGVGENTGTGEQGGRYYAVFLVNQPAMSETANLLEYDVLYSMNTKKEPAAISGSAGSTGTNAFPGGGFYPTVSPKITVAQLLDSVKNFFADAFSEDVRNHFGLQKQNTKMGQNLRYSRDLTSAEETPEQTVDINSPEEARQAIRAAYEQARSGLHGVIRANSVDARAVSASKHLDAFRDRLKLFDYIPKKDWTEQDWKMYAAVVTQGVQQSENAIESWCVDLPYKMQKSVDAYLDSTFAKGAVGMNGKRLTFAQYISREFPSMSDRQKKAVKTYFILKRFNQLAVEKQNGYIHHQQEILKAEADSHLTHLDDTKDTSMMKGRMLTMDRLLDNVFGENAEEIKQAYVQPIRDASARIKQARDKIAGKINGLHLSRKAEYEVFVGRDDNRVFASGTTMSLFQAAKKYYGETKQEKSTNDLKVEKQKFSESGLVQLYGEGILSDGDLNWIAGNKADKIRRAAKTFSEIYEELYQQLYDIFLKYGYTPPLKTERYFPHFTERTPDTSLAHALNLLGIDVQDEVLPTEISGLTWQFRPGKQWFSNTLHRFGIDTDYDAVDGLERYLTVGLNVIHQTDNIQRLNAFTDRIRYWTARENRRELEDRIDSNKNLTEQQKRLAKSKIFGAAHTTRLSNFVQIMEDMSKTLAGKKSDADRAMEAFFGRPVYNTLAGVEKRIAANMVGGNLSSAMSNFLAGFNAMSEIRMSDALVSLQDMMKGCRKLDGFADRSEFLTNRRDDAAFGSTVNELGGGWRGTAEKVNRAANLPFQAIDMFTAEFIVRAKYNEGIREGKTAVDAMRFADNYARSVMAGRNIADLPSIFNAKNPVFRVLTMFQLEQANQYQYLFHDLPKNMKEKYGVELNGRLGKKYVEQIILAAMKFFLGSLAYNTLAQAVIGRRPAVDPIYEIFFQIPENFSDGDAFSGVCKTTKDIVSEVPYIGSFLGGGRVPLSSALPDLSSIARALTDSSLSDSQRFQLIWKGISAPVSSFLLPAGGNQIKKSAEGIQDMLSGRRKNIKGKTLYTVDQTNPLNWVRALLFGKAATTEGHRYYSQFN